MLSGAIRPQNQPNGPNEWVGSLGNQGWNDEFTPKGSLDEPSEELQGESCLYSIIFYGRII